mmetsp:Transcript_14396/g.45946  ORF Transcript_14396/g.45946 Transcript_14396/m.45946 type:complete len:246 (+) Transcript_14396:648-1385(+)
MDVAHDLLLCVWLLHLRIRVRHHSEPTPLLLPQWAVHVYPPPVRHAVRRRGIHHRWAQSRCRICARDAVEAVPQCQGQQRTSGPPVGDRRRVCASLLPGGGPLPLQVAVVSLPLVVVAVPLPWTHCWTLAHARRPRSHWMMTWFTRATQTQHTMEYGRLGSENWECPSAHAPSPRRWPPPAHPAAAPVAPGCSASRKEDGPPILQVLAPPPTPRQVEPAATPARSAESSRTRCNQWYGSGEQTWS